MSSISYMSAKLRMVSKLMPSLPYQGFWYMYIMMRVHCGQVLPKFNPGSDQCQVTILAAISTRLLEALIDTGLVAHVWAFSQLKGPWGANETQINLVKFRLL